MRDVDAIRLVRETLLHAQELLEVLPLARTRLRDWKHDGYPTGGTGESSIGSNRHSDPVAQAVEATAIINRKTGNQLGFRPLDTYDDRLKELDRELPAIRTFIRDLTAELTDLIRLHPGDGIEGCRLCESVRLPIDDDGKALHRCDDACRARKHTHALAHQDIYSRKAPAVTVDDAPRCSWHYEFAERYGVDAHEAIALFHLDHLGERIPYALIREHHPDAVAQRNGSASGTIDLRHARNSA